ncbi:MAG TPA: hypothetical protein VJN90_03860 [Candidatus Acidoferrales bacterium]|nr:hypothetical protein [Candidatus Acidoferrales bacterium]
MAQAASTYLGEQRRRSTRIEQSLPLIIRGVDLLGQPFEERTATQSLSFHGCRYASKHHLPKNTWITIEVPAGHTQREPLNTRARVTWIQRPRTLRELFQVGVELETGSNVWGVALPPTDWASTGIKGIEPVPTSPEASADLEPVVKHVRSIAMAPQESPLESYLQSQLADDAELDGRESPLLRELRSQFESRAQKLVEEARTAAEQVVDERTGKLHSDLHNQLNQEQRATADAFYQKWRQEFESREAAAKEQMSSELAQRLTDQVAQVRQEVRENFDTSWGNAMERTQTALAEWERRAESLRDEARAVSEEAVRHAEERLDTKLTQHLNEFREELTRRAAAQGVVEHHEKTTDMYEGAQERLKEEMEAARKQWNELLESSLDSAAQRLATRVTDSSQQMLEVAEQKLASRVAELQEDSGLAAEAGRAALDDVKSALDQEINRTRTSLAEIEKAATHFSEYSRQLEAAGQDSLNELRQRLESSVALQVAELDRRGVDLQKQLVVRAESQLAEMSKRKAEQTAGEVHAKIAAVLERAAEATRQLSTHEQQAKDLLHVQRERLRQVSANVEQEVGQSMSSMLASLQGDFEQAGKEASARWISELDANAARAAEEASAGLAKSCENRLQSVLSRLDVRLEDSLDGTRKSVDEISSEAIEKYREQVEKMEASQLKASSERLEELSGKQVETANSQFEEAAGGVARTFGQVIQAAAEDAAERAAAESKARAEQERTRLEAIAGQVLRNLQERAETSFSQFQEQLAITTKRNLAQSHESLASQLAATLDVFRAQGKAQLAEWSATQDGLGDAAFERHEDRLRSAGNSWLDATVRQLDAANQNRMDSLIRGAEDAMRKACVDVFDGLAQAMKEKLLGAFSESRNTATAGEDDCRERRASA